MSDDDIGLFFTINEPSFVIDGEEYSVCCPDNSFYTSSPDGSEGVFYTVKELLDNWMINGSPFRVFIPSVMSQFHTVD